MRLPSVSSEIQRSTFLSGSGLVMTARCCRGSEREVEGSFAGEWLGETDCVPDSLLLSEGDDPTRVTELKLLGEQGALNTVASRQRIYYAFLKVAIHYGEPTC